MERAAARLPEDLKVKYTTVKEIQEVITRIIHNDFSYEAGCQTEEAVWNEIPDNLKYNLYAQDMSSNNKGAPPSGQGLRAGPLELESFHSQDSLDRKFEALKKQKEIETKEIEELNRQIAEKEEAERIYIVETGVQTEDNGV